MPPRKNTARRGRPFGKGGEIASPGGEASVGENRAQSSAAEDAVVTAAAEKPSGAQGNATTRAVKRPAATRTPVPKTGAAIAGAGVKKGAAAKPAMKTDPKRDKMSDGDDFEALVLDADDDDAGGADTEAPAAQEGADPNEAGEDNAAEGGDNPVAEEGGDEVEGDYEDAENLDAERNAEVGEEAGEALDGDEAAEEGWQEEGAEYADGEGGEYDGGEEDYGECLDADVLDDADGNEGHTADTGVGLEGDAAESDPVGAERPGEDGLVAAATGEEDDGSAVNESAEPVAKDGGENGDCADAEQMDEGAPAAEVEGETIVRDLAPSDRDFVMAEEEEDKEEETLEVTRLSELCPDVELEGPETITVSIRDSIQRSVRLFIERLLRDAKATGTAPPDSASSDKEEGKPSYGCRLCNVQLDQPEQFDCHTDSQRHSKRLRWMYFMGLNKELGKFHCRVCHISVPCKDHLVGHLRTDRHVCLSKALNVHPAYAEHLLGQHFPKSKVQFLLRSELQQQPSAGTATQPGTTSKGKEQKVQKTVDKRPEKAKPNAGGGNQQSSKESEPPPSQGFIFHCELCQVIAHHEDQIQEHYKGKKHRAKMAEELEKLSKQDPTKKAAAKGESAAQAAKGSTVAKKGPNIKPQQPLGKMMKGPIRSSPGATYTCFVCNVVLHSTREYSQHFTTRAHRLAASMQAAPPPMRKRPRSPSPFSRRQPPMGPWSPPRMRSPPRDIWSSGPLPRKRSPEPFVDPAFARDLYGGPQPGPTFDGGLPPPSQIPPRPDAASWHDSLPSSVQSSMLEEYTERRGSGPPNDPNSVAATLETMIQLQQRLLTMTGGGGGAGGGAGYHDDEFAAVARGLQDIDLQKSLQQLRQSQSYSVGGSSMDSPHGMSTFRDSGPSYQGDSYGGKRSYGGGPDMYSGAGDARESSYGSSFGGGSPRINEYRKSSLGPTAPRPPDFGRPSMGHLRTGGGGLGGKRY